MVKHAYKIALNLNTLKSLPIKYNYSACKRSHTVNLLVVSKTQIGQPHGSSLGTSIVGQKTNGQGRGGHGWQEGQHRPATAVATKPGGQSGTRQNTSEQSTAGVVGCSAVREDRVLSCFTRVVAAQCKWCAPMPLVTYRELWVVLSS